MAKIKTCMIVAMAENNCIGKDNRMPWHIFDDLKRFKDLTMGYPVIMGRKTFESIMGYLNKPLPGRKNIVISRRHYEAPEGVITCKNIDDAIFAATEEARKNDKDKIFIIGGAQIYDLSLPYAQILFLTQVHREVDGDAYFPTINASEWQEIAREDHLENDPPYSFIDLVRKEAGS